MAGIKKLKIKRYIRSRISERKLRRLFSAQSRRRRMSVSMLLGMLVALFIIVLYLRYSKIIWVHPLQGPRELAQNGYTGKVIAEKLLDHVRSIRQVAEQEIKDPSSPERPDSISSDNSRKDSKKMHIRIKPTAIDKPRIVGIWSDSDLAVEFWGTRITAYVISTFLNRLFGRQIPAVRGDIVLLDPETDRFRLTIRVRGNFSQTVDGNLGDIEEVIFRAAELFSLYMQTYSFAVYLYRTDQSPGKMRTINTIEYILRNKPLADDPPAYLIWAQILRDSGNLDEQVAKYKAALDIDPYFIHAHNNWGIALSENCKHKEAIAIFRHAVNNIDPNHAPLYFGWGVALGELGKHDEAITKYRKALELKKDYYKAYYNWGNSLRSLNRYREAIKKYEEALEINPRYALAHLNIGVVLQSQGNHEDAIVKFRRALDLKPDYVKAYNNWGISLDDLGEYEQAIAKYKRALEIVPEYALAHNNWASSLIELKQYKDAIVHCQEAIKLDSTIGTPYFIWGHALNHIEQYMSAIDKYEKAIALDSTILQDALPALHYLLVKIVESHGDVRAFERVVSILVEGIEKRPKLTSQLKEKLAGAYYEWGNYFFNQEEYVTSIAKYKEAKSLAAGQPELDRQITTNIAVSYNRLGRASHLSGDPRKAELYFRTAIETNPNLDTAYLNLAFVLVDIGSPDEVLSMALRAVELDPRSASNHTALGLAYTNKGDLTKALQELREAVSLAPGFGHAHTNLGNVYAIMKDYDNARASYQKACTLGDEIACRQLKTLP